jgi:peptide deformylase
VQHETDHLDGVLFIDRLDTEAKRDAMRAIRESEWWGTDGAGSDPVVKVSPHSSAQR